jgi:cell division protein FtsZ
MGPAMMGTGEAAGEQRAVVAAEEAIVNPLLDDVSLKGAKSLLLSITGGSNLTLWEVDEAANRVRQEVDPEANIIVGATFDDALGERVRVSIVASGMGRHGRLPQEAAAGEAARSKAAASGTADYRWRLGQAMSACEREERRVAEAPTAPPWEGPGGVVIKEGPPRLGGGEPPERPAGPRQEGNNFPALEDFPPHAQQLYRARSRERRAAPEPERGDMYQQPIPQPQTGPFGLLRRLAETARGRRQEGAMGATETAPELHDEVDLPVFFGRGKRS